MRPLRPTATLGTGAEVVVILKVCHLSVHAHPRDVQVTWAYAGRVVVAAVARVVSIAPRAAWPTPRTAGWLIARGGAPCVCRRDPNEGTQDKNRERDAKCQPCTHSTHVRGTSAVTAPHWFLVGRLKLAPDTRSNSTGYGLYVSRNICRARMLSSMTRRVCRECLICPLVFLEMHRGRTPDGYLGTASRPADCT